jgi:drug/metabolite transporter (DMT)-like permease
MVTVLPAFPILSASASGSGVVGETAAVFTAVLWTGCAILFASAGRRIGALSVNAFRIVMAVVLLGIAHAVIFGSLVPHATGGQWLYMGLSGIIGLAIGDFGYFGCLVMIGPRRGVLLMATAPIFSAVMGYLVLGEVLSAWNIFGIALTLAGVFVVILDENVHESEVTVSPRHTAYGVLAGLGGAIGQGVGLVVSKYGMIRAGGEGAPPLDPLPATLVRMIVAAGFVWITIALAGKLRRVLAAARDTRAIGRTFAGAMSGPFLGVWLSMVAVTYTAAGVAATLMALMPVMVIPVLWVVYRQKTSLRGMVGAAVAVVGVAVLFLV